MIRICIPIIKTEMKSSSIQEIDLNELIADTTALARSMYVVKGSFGLKPDREHFGTFIDYTDLEPMTERFVQELVNTVIDYVYSYRKSTELIEKMQEEGRTPNAASRELYQHAKEKFRLVHIHDTAEDWELARGQFSELLLFNLLQHFFKAIPLVRKMPITTSSAHERYGADAIHIGYNNGKLVLFLGEAKTYDRKTATFSSAFRKSVRDLITHYHDLRSELNLYVYDDFVSPELEQISQEFLNGDRKDLEVHMVALVAFQLNGEATGNSREEIIASSINNLHNEIERLNPSIFEEIDHKYLSRMNYVVFAEEKLAGLIQRFIEVI